MSGVNGSFTRVSVHVGGDWTVRCATYQGHTPLLEVGAGETEVSFCLAGQGHPGLNGGVRYRVGP